jgi:hypothetical protein
MCQVMRFGASITRGEPKGHLEVVQPAAGFTVRRCLPSENATRGTGEKALPSRILNMGCSLYIIMEMTQNPVISVLKPEIITMG